MRKQPCFLGGTFIHLSILQMCVGPGAGSAAVTQTDKVAALLEVTLLWELENYLCPANNSCHYLLNTCVVFAVILY